MTYPLMEMHSLHLSLPLHENIAIIVERFFLMKMSPNLISFMVFSVIVGTYLFRIALKFCKSIANYYNCTINRFRGWCEDMSLIFLNFIEFSIIVNKLARFQAYSQCLSLPLDIMTKCNHSLFLELLLSFWKRYYDTSVKLSSVSDQIFFRVVLWDVHAIKYFID